MNLKRAIAFGLIMWVLIFVVISSVMFMPVLKDKEMVQNIIFWVLLIPMILLSAKWYFKTDSPTLAKGFFLGVIGLAVSTVLDMAITVPLFVKSYSSFYSDWQLYVGFLIYLLVCVYSGFEFDATYTKPANKEDIESAKNTPNIVSK